MRAAPHAAFLPGALAFSRRPRRGAARPGLRRLTIAGAAVPAGLLPVGSVALTAGTVACCAGGAVLVQVCLGPAATAAINSGAVLGLGGGKQRETEPAADGEQRPSARRRGRRKKPARWLTARASELRDHPDLHRTRFGVDRVGLNSLAGLVPDAATVGAAGVAATVACHAGGRGAAAAAGVGVICTFGLRTKVVVEGLEMGDSNGLVAACAPELPVEATSVRVGRIELCLSWRLQLGVRVRDVSVELRPYDLGSKALHYARLRRRVESRAAHATEVARRQDALEDEQHFNARQRNAQWLGRSSRLGIYRAVASWWHPRGSRVRRVSRGESAVLAWLGLKAAGLLRMAGVAMAAAAITGSCICSLTGGSAQSCRDTARLSAKAAGVTGLIAAFFADSLAAAVLDRVYVEVDRVDVSFTDRGHTARITCDEIRWQRLAKPTTLARRTLWQRWVWSTYGPLPSLHSLSTSPIVCSVSAQDGPANASLTVAPLVVEVSVVVEHGAARTHVDVGLPTVSVSSCGRHVLAARSLRSLRSDLVRGSKVMQFGLQRLWTPSETPRRRWHHAICSVLIDCQRRAGKSTLVTALKTRGLKFAQRRAARLWSYAFRCVKMELLRAQYGRSKLTATSNSEPMPRAPRVNTGTARSQELEELDLDDLQEQALASGVESSQLELAEGSHDPRDATISLLLGAEQASAALRSDRRWSIQIDAVEAFFAETGDEVEATTAKLSAKSLRTVRTSREALGSALPSIAMECSIGKWSLSLNSVRVLQTTTHSLTARSANCFEMAINSSLDLRARIGAVKVALTPDVLQTIATLYTQLDMAADEFVPTLASSDGAVGANMFSDRRDTMPMFVVQEETTVLLRETRRLRHRHRPQVDMKANLPIVQFGSDDAKRFFELDLGTVNAGNTSTELRCVLTSAARLDSTRCNAVGCKWEGAKATFASKTSGGRQSIFKGFGGTASVQICALSADHMWAQKCPQLQLSLKLQPLEAQATLSTASGLMDLMSEMLQALSDSGSLDGARGDVVEVTPPNLGDPFAATLEPLELPDAARSSRWCLRHVDFEPREWKFSVLDEQSARPVLNTVIDVDALRLQEFNTGHRNLDLEVNLHAYAYNAPAVAWEPVIEPWKATLTSLQAEDETNVKLSGEQLNINLSPSLVRSLGYGSRQSGARESAGPAQTWLVNCTGTAIRHKSTCACDQYGRTLPREVRSQRRYCQLEDRAEGLLELTMPAEAGIAFDQGLAIEFPDVLWHDTEFMDVSREGMQSKVIDGSMAGITVVCVTDIQNDGTRVITLCSGVKVENQTNRDIEFGLRRCDIAGNVGEHVDTAMVVLAESNGFFPAAMWAANLHDKRSSQLAVFRTCDGGDDVWSDPYDVQQPIAANAAKLIVCNEGTESHFTCCLSVDPGYAPAGKLSTLTLFNCLDVLNEFAHPIELEFFEEAAAADPSGKPLVPCVAGNELTRSRRRIIVDPGARIGVPEWDPKKDAWMAVSDCEGAISPRVCVYRAHDSDDQSLASDVAMYGGQFAISSIYATETSKLSTDKGMEYASCLPLSLHYAAQGSTAAAQGDASHLVTLSCSYLVLNKTTLPLVVRSRHGKRSDRDVVVSLPAYDLDIDEIPKPLPFTSHGNIELGVRVDEPRAPEADLNHPDAMMVTILCAKDLRGGLIDMLSMDVPDAYVKVTFTPRRAADDSTAEKPHYVMEAPVHIGRTVAIQDTADPVWNARFLMRVPADGGILSLKVMDYDRWSGDDSIGEVKLDVEHGVPIEQSVVDVLGLGGIRKGHMELELTKAAGCTPLTDLVVNTWGSRVVSTAQSGPQLLPVSLGLDDVGVTMAPLNRSPGAPHLITIVPRYRVDNLSRHNVMVAVGKREGRTLEVRAGESEDVFGLASGVEPLLFFKAEQTEGLWSALSRGVVADEGHFDPTVDSTRITCGHVKLDVRYEVQDGTGVFAVHAGTPAVVVENLALDQVWIAREEAMDTSKKKKSRTTQSGRSSRRQGGKLKWIRLNKTDRYCFHEWDWRKEDKIRLKTWNDETRTIDVSTLTDPSSEGWSWAPIAGETVWPQVLVVNNTRILRIGKTAVRPRDDDIESTFKLNAALPGVGFSVIGDATHGRAAELLYASLHSVALQQIEEDGRTTTDFRIGRFQVDEYVNESERPGRRDMIAGPRLSGKQSTQSSILHVQTVRVYQPGPALFESFLVKTNPMFLNLKWSTVSCVLRERSVQHLCTAFMFAEWNTDQQRSDSKSLLQSVQIDPVTIAVHFDMAGCVSDSKLLEVLALDRYTQQLHVAGEQDTGLIRTQRISLNDIFYTPQQVLSDVAADMSSLVATRLMASSSSAVDASESVLAMHQKASKKHSTSRPATRSSTSTVEDALVLATEPPLTKMMEMVNKVTDTAPGRQHRNNQSIKNTRSEAQLFAARWPRVFGANGVIKDYSANDIVLWKLLQKSGCCEGRELDERCLSILAVAEPENPASRSLMLLTKHTIFFAKPVTHVHSVARRAESYSDVGPLEAVFGDEIAVRDIREVEMNLSEGTLFLRLSGCERLFTTDVGPRDTPLETEFKLAEFFNHLVDLLEEMRKVAAHYRRFSDSAGESAMPPKPTRQRPEIKDRDHGVGKGITTAGTLRLIIQDADWENLCAHGRRYDACKLCKRLKLKPEKPNRDDWFCELQVGKHRPRKLEVGKEIKFDIGGGPRCVVALKNAAAIGEKCVGITELRVDSSTLGPDAEERWWSLSPLPGSTETPGARVKMSLSCSPRVDDSLLVGPRDATMLQHTFDTCTVLSVDIKSIRLPEHVQVIHGEKLTCALKVVHENEEFEEKDAFVLVSATEQRSEAHGLEPVIFDLTEMRAAGRKGARTFVRAQLLLDDGHTVVCEEKFPFPGPQVGWSRMHDQTTLDEEDDNSARVRRRGDIDVSISVDAIRASWTNVDAPVPPRLVEYMVTLKTGKHGDAATSASIFVQLIGDRGHSARIPLQLSAEDIRAGGIVPGGTNVFRIAAPKIGKLQRLRIGHDNTGQATVGRSQAWFLDSAAVKRVPPSVDDLESSGSDDEPTPGEDTADGVVFPCGEWFGRPSPVPTAGMTSAVAREKNPGFKGKPLIYTGDVALTRELMAQHMKPANLLDTYSVTVSTGCIGTDGSVSITLFGSDGDSGSHELRHRKGGSVDTKRSTFEAGAVETFALESFALGRLQYITLALSAVDHTKPSVLPELFAVPRHGPNDRDARTIAIEKQLTTGWMCEHVTIRNVRTMQCWSLPVQCLLASKTGGAGGIAGLSRTVTLGPAKQLAVYRVTVCTGDVLAAGTEATVSLRMVGQNGQSDLLRLQRSAGDTGVIAARGDNEQPFQRGQLDEFELEIIDIGAVSQIELSHDGRGVGSGWYVDEVLIERLGTTVQAAEAAADAPTFGRDSSSRFNGASSRRHNRSYGGSGSDSGSSRRSSSRNSRSLQPGAQAGRLTHPLAHHRQDEVPRSRIGGSGFGRSGRSNDVALEPVQTRFVVQNWIEETPMTAQVDLDDPRTLAAGRHSARWLITVKTGTMEFAATSSSVSLTLRGTSGEGGTHRLDRTTALSTPRKGPFARGAESIFSLRTADLGALSELTVSHDNSGITTERAAWFLEWIEAIDEATGEHYHFPCAQWLGGGRTRLESLEDFEHRCGGVVNDGALYRILAPLGPGEERRDPVRRVMEKAEDTLGTLVVKRLRVLDPISSGAVRLALSRKRTYVRLSCGAAKSTQSARSNLSTSVHGSQKGLSNARASASWGDHEVLRLRVGNTTFGQGELKLVAMGKEKTFGMEASLVMEGRDKPTPVGQAAVKLKDAFPEAFGDRKRFRSVGGMHHAVYELRPPSLGSDAPARPPLRVEVLLMFLPNRSRSYVEWSRKTDEPQLRHSVPDLPEDYDWDGDMLLDSDLSAEFEPVDEDTMEVRTERY